MGKEQKNPLTFNSSLLTTNYSLKKGGCVIVEKENTVRHKSVVFAKRIIRLYKYLCDEKKEFVMSKQLLRCGTSIGANIAEAECGISRKDFLAKMYIAFKECAETEYWLELLLDDYMSSSEYKSIKMDCDELMKMLTSITKTTRSSLLTTNCEATDRERSKGGEVN